MQLHVTTNDPAQPRRAKALENRKRNRRRLQALDTSPYHGLFVGCELAALEALGRGAVDVETALEAVSRGAIEVETENAG